MNQDPETEDTEELANAEVRAADSGMTIDLP